MSDIIVLGATSVHKFINYINCTSVYKFILIENNIYTKFGNNQDLIREVVVFL